MKFLVISVLFLLSSTSFASGFLCSGQGYRVKLYNEVQPELGTSNPSTLVVSAETATDRTIAVLRGEEIRKIPSARAHSYKGVVNAKATGHFLSVRLDVVKTPQIDGKYFGLLRLANDNEKASANMICSRYTKSN